MHFFGFHLHPLTAPIANELSQCLTGSVKQVLLVYVTVVRPSVEDFVYVWKHIE